MTKEGCPQGTPLTLCLLSSHAVHGKGAEVIEQECGDRLNATRYDAGNKRRKAGKFHERKDVDGSENELDADDLTERYEATKKRGLSLDKDKIAGADEQAGGAHKKRDHDGEQVVEIGCVGEHKDKRGVDYKADGIKSGVRADIVFEREGFLPEITECRHHCRQCSTCARRLCSRDFAILER